MFGIERTSSYAVLPCLDMVAYDGRKSWPQDGATTGLEQPAESAKSAELDQARPGNLW